MIPVGRAVTVRVPATTANLGPGFDTLGLALALYDELTVTVRDAPGAFVDVHGVGEGEVPTDDTNLVVRSIAHTFAAYGQEMPGLDLVARNVIPHGRGLGSSGAAIASGVVAAQGLLEGVVEIDALGLLARATELDEQTAATPWQSLVLAVDIKGATVVLHPDDVKQP